MRETATHLRECVFSAKIPPKLQYAQLDPGVES